MKLYYNLDKHGVELQALKLHLLHIFCLNGKVQFWFTSFVHDISAFLSSATKIVRGSKRENSVLFTMSSYKQMTQIGTVTITSFQLVNRIIHQLK